VPFISGWTRSFTAEMKDRATLAMTPPPARHRRAAGRPG
jgi:hypothetical protein